jgi:cellulose biosynthesis protein BcsQ
MHSNIYDVFHSQPSDRHVSGRIAAILRVTFLLQEYNFWLTVSPSVHNNYNYIIINVSPSLHNNYNYIIINVSPSLHNNYNYIIINVSPSIHNKYNYIIISVTVNPQQL